MRHRLGTIDVVHREYTPALSRDVGLALPVIQRAWPSFEQSFDSLRGRKFLGGILQRERICRLCSTRLESDTHRSFGLDDTSIPGGCYLRLRLVGQVPAV